MISYFPKTLSYLNSVDISTADPIDKKVNSILQDEASYERASQALRRRFVRGATEVDAVDRGGRRSKIKREKASGKYKYLIQGMDGNWFEPDERVWVVAMYALWQDTK